MANIVITSKGTSGIYVDFGVYEDDSAGLYSPQGFNSNRIDHVFDDGTGVEVVYSGRDPQRWYLCHASTTGYMIVDSIDGVAPTSIADLVSKITALM